MSFLETEIVWLKKRKVDNEGFIADSEVLISGSGSTIIFTSLKNGVEKYYHTNNPAMGDGVACIAGHKTLPMFVFSELSIHPKLYVTSYPTFDVIAILNDPDVRYYNTLTFSETDHLIALTGIPHYSVKIWNWRTSTLMCSIISEINFEFQLLRVSPVSPLTICQLSMYTPQMKIYEIHGSSDVSKLIDRKINLPFIEQDGPFHCVFGIDGLINLVIGNGDVYQITPTIGTVKLIIEWTEDKTGDSITGIAVYKGGLLVAGPDTSVKYYRKQIGTWSEIVHIKMPNSLYYMRCLYHKEIVIGITVDNCIYSINPESDKPIDLIKKWDEPIKFYTLLNPICDIVVAVNVADQVITYSTESDTRISEIFLEHVFCIQEHPIYPIVMFGSENGILTIVSFFNVKIPRIITELYISHTALKQIIISPSLSYLVVNDMRKSIFIIKEGLNGSYSILYDIRTEYHFISFCVSEDVENLYIMGIILHEQDRSSELYASGIAGTFAMAITVSKDKEKGYTSNAFSLTYHYKKLVAHSEDLTLYYGQRYMETSLHLLKLNENRNGFVDNGIFLHTVHKLKSFDVYVHKNEFILTWGIDGIVALYDFETKKLNGGFLGHHRSNCGVWKARIDPFRTHVITMGYTGTLICTKILNSEPDIDQLTEMKETIKQAAKINSLKKLNGYIPENRNDRWTDIKAQKRIQRDIEIYEPIRKDTFQKLEVLTDKLRILIDNNEKAPPEEQLSLQNFNLNSDLIESQLELARKDRKSEEETTKHYIQQIKRVTDWIKSICWDTMSVKGTKIRGFFTKLNVENYALQMKDENFETYMQFVNQSRQSEILVSKEDKFLPWKLQTVSKLELLLTKSPEIVETEEFEKFEESEDIINKYSLTGTSSHKFIEPIANRYEQFEVVTHFQMNIENILAWKQNLMIREFFNDKFIELQELKEIELQSILKRNARLRAIQGELQILAQLLNSEGTNLESIIDPVYTQDEKPETIVIVQDWEVPVTPYVSPSVEKLRREEFEEAERKRLAMLADDFRDRALEAMMHGVLEIRWEDEIKKNPSLPLCLENGKDPKEYDENDLHQIQEYEDQLKYLRSERERYRSLLEEEHEKIQQIQDTQILRFNFKVGELLLLKMKVDSAIRQEELKLLRNAHYNYKRQSYIEKEEQLKTRISNTNEQIMKFNVIMNELEQMSTDIHIEYEALTTKDKLLDKQFKSNFADTVSRSIVDQVYKIFKRRPRWQMRAWTTPTILVDLGKRVIAKNSSEIGPPLPQECFDFLHSLDQLDNFSLAPNAIDHNLWKILCKMRRVKVESEMKIKGCGLHLAEIETTINSFSKELNTRKSEIVLLERELEEVSETRVEASMNRAVQLVMKRGNVEIALSGHISDFSNSILLKINDVNDINQIIKRAGKKKLKTMQGAAKFHRRIIQREWEHNVLKMTVRDLRDFKRTIEKSKITKEVQRWLKQKEKGWSDDISQAALDREIEASLKSCERLLLEKIKFGEELAEKIYLKRRENELLDKKIQILNVRVTEQQMSRDVVLEEREVRERKERMFFLTERAKMVRLVQQQHSQILELSTLLELQRLRTFPTLTVLPTVHTK